MAGGYSLALAGAILACSVMLRLSGQPIRTGAAAPVLSAITFLPEQQQQRIAGVLEAFSQGVECTRDLGLLAQLLGYTRCLEWAVIAGQDCFALFNAFRPPKSLGILDILVLLAFMTLGSLVQVPGLGGGVQVASIVALTKIYGVPLESAAGIAIVLWFVSSIAIVPFGIACAFREGLRLE